MVQANRRRAYFGLSPTQVSTRWALVALGVAVSPQIRRSCRRGMHRHVGVPGESAPRAPSTDRSLKVTACVALVGAMFFLKLVGPGDTSDERRELRGVDWPRDAGDGRRAGRCDPRPAPSAHQDQRCFSRLTWARGCGDREGYIWATTPRDGALWRIDPKTNEAKRIPIPYPLTGVTANEVDAWVAVHKTCHLGGRG